jgi:hypothetical protein
MSKDHDHPVPVFGCLDCIKERDKIQGRGESVSMLMATTLKQAEILLHDADELATRADTMHTTVLALMEELGDG